MAVAGIPPAAGGAGLRGLEMATREELHEAYLAWMLNDDDRLSTVGDLEDNYRRLENEFA